MVVDSLQFNCRGYNSMLPRKISKSQMLREAISWKHAETFIPWTVPLQHHLPLPIDLLYKPRRPQFSKDSVSQITFVAQRLQNRFMEYIPESFITNGCIIEALHHHMTYQPLLSTQSLKYKSNMEKFCCAIGCSKLSDRNKDVSFFTVPSEWHHLGDETRELYVKQRKKWHMNIRQDTVFKGQIKQGFVCSLHFHKGRIWNRLITVLLMVCT